MNANRQCTRRVFLGKGFLMGLVFAASPFLAIRMSLASNKDRTANNERDYLSRKLANVFESKESAKIIGKEYLRVSGQKLDVQTLMNHLCHSNESVRLKLAHAGPRRLREMLALQKRQDFEDGRVIILRGCMLSMTEVYLCTLAALV